MVQCIFDVGLTLKQNAVIVPCSLGLRHCYAGDAFLSPSTERPLHWPNGDVMLGHRLSRRHQPYLNLIPSSSNHVYNCEYIFLTLFQHATLGHKHRAINSNRLLITTAVLTSRPKCVINHLVENCVST